MGSIHVTPMARPVSSKTSGLHARKSKLKGYVLLLPMGGTLLDRNNHNAFIYSGCLCEKFEEDSYEICQSLQHSCLASNFIES